MQVAPISMIPPPAKLPLPSQLTPGAPWEVLYDQSTKEEKIEAWFTNGSAQHSGTTQKRTVIAPEPHLGVALKH